MNNIERAIQSIQLQKLNIGIDYTRGKDITAICLIGEQAETTIIALEKQIQKKPEYIDEDLRYFDCPVCKESILASDDFESHKYCLNCGQAIDWSE